MDMILEHLKHLKGLTERFRDENRDVLGYGAVYHLDEVIKIYAERIDKAEGKGVSNGGSERKRSLRSSRKARKSFDWDRYNSGPEGWTADHETGTDG